MEIIALRRLDLVGKQFGRWVVISYSDDKKWLCRCVCGTSVLVAGGSLVTGTSKSCGCLRNELSSIRIRNKIRNKTQSIKPPLYTMPGKIEVIGEYAPTEKNPYWRLRIRPHPFFPRVKESGGGIEVRRSRAALASKIGRVLFRSEHVHHVDGDLSNDDPCNLKLLSASDHNRHHKLGKKHSKLSKKRISLGLKRSYRENRHIRPIISERDDRGRIIS